MPASSSRGPAPASGRNANIHYDPANMHHVAVLALDRSSRSTSRSRPRSSATTRRRRTASRSARRRLVRCRPPRGSPSSPRPASTRSPSPTPCSSPASRPTCASRPSQSCPHFARHRSAVPAGLDLHRGVRARRRRRVGRPPRHHPLARRRRPRGALPPSPRRARRALRRRGNAAHVGGRRLRPRPVPAHPPHRPRRRAREPHRPPSRRPTPPRGRPGPIRRPAAPTHAGGSLAATRAWALERLGDPLTVRALAAHAHVSERTFARRFTAETGVPVLQWLLARRVDAARAALESTDARIDEIADTCGFGTAANLRKHFHRHVSTTPTAYRRTFAPT